MGVFVKICGVCSANDARMIASYRPDAMGFVFWPQSKRCVDPQDVASWMQDIPASIKRVGVFVSPTVQEVEVARDRAGITIAQIHGDIDAALYENPPLPLWESVQLETDTAASVAGHPVDAFLVDSYTPDSPGGTGKLSDWDLAARFVTESDTPTLLSGGLKPDNVAAAIAKVHPWGVDVSSGVEVRPREKSEELVRLFIESCPR